MLVGLQIAQIALIILPGEPLEMLAGMCYGTVGGMLVIFATVAITTAIIYYLTSKYGKKFLYNFFSKEKIDKIEKSKLFRNPAKVEMIMMILFLIPGTPKDLLTYIGALLPMKPLRFIMIATFARFPSVISSTMAGNTLTNGNWRATIIIYLVTIIVTAIFIYYMNKKNKRMSKEMIDILK